MSPPDQPRQRPPRKLWRLIATAGGLALNLYLLTIEVRMIMEGGQMTGWTVFATAMCGIFAAMLYAELGKPKP